jgi:hypothetical protein
MNQEQKNKLFEMLQGNDYVHVEQFQDGNVLIFVEFGGFKILVFNCEFEQIDLIEFTAGNHQEDKDELYYSDREYAQARKVAIVEYVENMKILEEEIE